MNINALNDALDKIGRRMAESYPAHIELKRKLRPRTLEWKGTVDNQKGNYGYHVYEQLDGQCMLIDPMHISKSTSGFFKVGSIEEGKKIAEQSFQKAFDYLTDGCWKEVA